MQPQIAKYVAALEEQSYRVTLKNDAAREANRAFEDDPFFKATWFSRVWAETFRAKLDALGVSLEPGLRILDVCCGQGFLGRSLREGSGADPVFCDISLRQLRHLKAGFGREGKIEISSGDVTRLPFASARFDLVTGNSFLHHVPDVPLALAEFYRVLRPDGLLILFHEPGERATFWESFPLSLFKDTTIREGPCTDLWMFAPEDLERLARQAGFSRVGAKGSGIVSAVLLNWYQLLLIRLGIRNRSLNYPSYRLRLWLAGLELRWAPRRFDGIQPSLTLLAFRAGSP